MAYKHNLNDPVRPRQPLRAWLDVRGRREGSWAFALNRLTAIALTVYLFLHLAVLSLLLQGAEGWDQFVEIARSPWVLALDVFLIFAMVFHGLNGIRVALVGMGIGARHQKTLLWVLVAIGAVLVLVSAWLIFTI